MRHLVEQAIEDINGMLRTCQHNAEVYTRLIGLRDSLEQGVIEFNEDMLAAELDELEPDEEE